MRSISISFKRHRFPPEVIRQAVWLYFRFTLNLCDVEEMLAERGVDVSYTRCSCFDSAAPGSSPEAARRDRHGRSPRSTHPHRPRSLHVHR
jgi:transposase-like protein